MGAISVGRRHCVILEPIVGSRASAGLCPWRPGTRNARYVDTITHISQHVKENVEAYALTQAEIKRLRAVYVRTTTTDRAAEIMRAQNAVTLVGPRGCGRRITGVAVITELGATPHRIDLDPGDTRRELPVDPGCGYIVDIDEQTVRDIPALSELLTRYGEQLAAVNAYLVITTAEEVWNLLELRNRIASVSVRPPSPIDVFRSHLEHVHPVPPVTGRSIRKC
jgi:hypothetical protein